MSKAIQQALSIMGEKPGDAYNLLNQELMVKAADYLDLKRLEIANGLVTGDDEEEETPEYESEEE